VLEETVSGIWSNTHQQQLALAADVDRLERRIAELEKRIASWRLPTGYCSAHRHGEDPTCCTCYPQEPEGNCFLKPNKKL
jgi:hypothetical protein